MDSRMIMVAIAAILVSLTTAQAQIPSCLQALLPCQPFMASPAPPEACCGPLKKAFETELACLCAAFSNPDFAGAFDMNQAMQLPVKCGVQNAGPNMCINGGLPSPSPPSPPGATAPPTSSPSTVPPPPPSPQATAPPTSSPSMVPP
ncbi:non-specific lipid transfer protein GPI-anchored 9-like, partial [Silene latifolia]|uniref:non-specific lipid transfer protein GPI-anchored 9-like n=1 Tax=Silene latifolia TaxID=37657 RepID=UPI003D7782BB